MVYHPAGQVPWHPFTGRLLQIALSDIKIRVGPRDEADWEEGPAGKRGKVWLTIKQVETAE